MWKPGLSAQQHVNLTWWLTPINSNALDVEAEGSELQDSFSLHIELKSNLGYMRLYLNKQTTLKVMSGENTGQNETEVYNGTYGCKWHNEKSSSLQPNLKANCKMPHEDLSRGLDLPTLSRGLGSYDALTLIPSRVCSVHSQIVTLLKISSAWPQEGFITWGECIQIKEETDDMEHKRLATTRQPEKWKMVNF